MGYRVIETVTLNGALRVRIKSTGHNGTTKAERDRKKFAALARHRQAMLLKY